MQQHPDERAWIEAARRGDVAAFNCLIALYEQLAYNVALRTLGQVDDAADATQDALLSAFRNVKSLRGKAFRPWLLRIVVNTCYDLMRRRRRQPATSLELLIGGGAMPALDPPAPGLSPESSALNREVADLMVAALGRLPTDQRLVAVLCDVQELSYEEAATVLDVPIGTIRSRLSRARARLRDELRAAGELPIAAARPTEEESNSA